MIIMADRGAKGILGVPHAKHRPMMFAFCPVKGDEWPSSSDDSDEDFVVNKRKDKQRSGDGKRRSRHVKTVRGTKNESRDDECSWGKLPELILHRMFHFGVQENGAVPFLIRMSRVCQAWHNAAKSPSLWRCVNLDQSAVKVKEAKRYSALAWLVDNRFSKLEELNLSGWSRLHHSSLEKLLEKCPTIRKINLTGCIKLNSASITSLVEKLPDLMSIDLTSMSLPGQCLPTNISLLWEKRGGQLQELILSKNNLRRWPKLFDSVLNIPNSMPKMTLLDLSNCSFNSASVVVFPVEAFQLACPNLETLCLAGCSMIGSKINSNAQISSQGFPKLKQLSFPVVPQIHHTASQHQDLLQRLLKSSVKLQLLDIRGHSSFTSEFSQNLPCTDVEYLYIGQGDQNMLALCGKWSHSLIVLDMSDVTVEDSMAIPSLLPSLTKLNQLVLSGTNIEESGLRLIFKSCPTLKELNLTRCRNIPRGMKQCFQGERLQELAAKFLQPLS